MVSLLKSRNEKQVRVAVLASGGGTNFKALCEKAESGELPHVKLCLLISSNENAGALGIASQYDIKARVAKKEEEILALLLDEKIEIVVLAGFLKILSSDFIKCFPDRIINIHPSLIPAFCGKGFYGLKVHEAALKAGVKVTGATVHLVNDVVDGGKILLQKPVTIDEGMTPEELQKKVLTEAEHQILYKAVEKEAIRLLKEKGNINELR